jgi:acetyl esterase/lipase
MLKRTLYIICCILIVALSNVSAQIFNPIKEVFPKGTILYGNIPYANDTLKSHLLDIYLPPTGKKSYPVLIWIHGGGWRKGDKYGEMNYMANTVKSLVNKGYAIASINYRYSNQAKFPAQIQDCNQAVEFLYQHAAQYRLDRDKLALIGFSAGGHLAALLGLSNNNTIGSFYPEGKKPHFKIKLVFDFFGINDLLALKGLGATDPHSGVTLLLGASAADRPDLAKTASPVTYIDKDDPPFLVVHGDKDEAVDFSQSTLLSSKLKAAGVKNGLIMVPGAPHAGEMFDAKYIRQQVFLYLREYLK